MKARKPRIKAEDGPKKGRSRSQPPTTKEKASLEYVSAHDLVNGQARAFLWKDHVLFRALTVIEGPKGSGKSSLLAAIAADVTGGPRLDASCSPRASKPVLWFAGEEDPVYDVRPKLAAAGACLSKVLFAGRDLAGQHTRRLSLPGDASLLCDLGKKTGVGALVLDPWSSCLPPGTSTSDPVTTRQTMEVLAHVAQETGAAVVITRNFRKDQSGGALASGLGSSEVANVARAVIQLRPHPDKHRSYVCCVAACNAFCPPLPRAYSLKPKDGAVVVQWKEVLDLTADQLAEGDVSSMGRDERRDALSVLSSILSGSWVPVKDLLEEARKAGVCERTLRSAKAEQRIVSRRVDSAGHVHYEWGPPPAEDAPAPKE